ncbi:MAG: GNAT family N-acetyltransferase [Pseudomonadota bacterium]
MKLLFKLHQNIEEIEQQWTKLGEQQQQFYFYQKPDWFKTISQTLINKTNAKNNNKLYYIGIYQQSTLLGIIPIEYLQLKKFGLSLKVICFPTHSLLDLSDCLIHQSIQPFVLEELIKFLNNNKDLLWDVIFFSATPEYSCTNKLFANKHIKNYYCVKHGASSFINCENTFEKTTAHISSKFKRNLKRLERKAEKQGELSYHTFLSQAKNQNESEKVQQQFEQAYQDFLDIEADSWKSGTHTAIKCKQQSIQFYQQLAKNFQYPDNCLINILKINNQAIATQIGIIIGKQLNLLKIGFRQDYKSIGPGNIILSHTIKQAIQHKNKQISTVTAPRWAEKWKSDSVILYRHIIFKASLSGFMAKLFFLLLPLLKKIRTKLERNSCLSQKHK